MSALDTVTCALGGSIVLMLLMASRTLPEAPIVFVEQRQVLASGAQPESRTSQGRPTALLLLSIRHDSPVDSSPLVLSGCGGVDGRSLSSRNILHADLDADWTEKGLLVWGDMDVPCKRPVVKQQVSGSAGCRMLLVSGAHYDERRMTPCPTKIRLRSTTGQAFAFHGFDE